MRITRRGRLVRAVLILAGVCLALWMASRLWWTGGGWCIGSMAECVGI